MDKKGNKHAHTKGGGADAESDIEAALFALREAPVKKTPETQIPLDQLAAERVEEMASAAQEFIDEQSAQVARVEASIELPPGEMALVRQETGIDAALQEVTDTARQAADSATSAMRKPASPLDSLQKSMDALTGIVNSAHQKEVGATRPESNPAHSVEEQKPPVVIDATFEVVGDGERSKPSPVDSTPKAAPPESTSEISQADATALAAWRAYIEDVFAQADAELDAAEKCLDQNDLNGYALTRKATEESLSELSSKLESQGLTQNPKADELMCWWVEQDSHRAERMEGLAGRIGIRQRTREQLARDVMAKKEGKGDDASATERTDTEQEPPIRIPDAIDRERERILNVLERIVTTYENDLQRLDHTKPTETDKDRLSKHAALVQNIQARQRLLQKLIAQGGVANREDISGIKGVIDSKKKRLKDLARQQAERKTSHFTSADNRLLPTLAPNIMAIEHHVEALETVFAEYRKMQGMVPKNTEFAAGSAQSAQTGMNAEIPEDILPEKAAFEDEGGGQPQGIQPKKLPEPASKPEAEPEKEVRLAVSAESIASEEHLERNEDAMLVMEKKGVFAVFDGLGGRAAGDYASQRTKRFVERTVVSSFSDTMSQEEASRMMAHVLQKASEMLHRESMENDAMKDMGTTVSLVKILEEAGGTQKAIIGNVGDSRVYILHQDGTLEQITLDDSYVREMFPNEAEARAVQKKLSGAVYPAALSDDESLCYRKRNILTQYIGQASIQARMHMAELAPGDRILITSDGVHDNLTDDEMAKLRTAKELVDAAQQRSREGSERSKPDDMTAIVIEVPATAQEKILEKAAEKAENITGNRERQAPEQAAVAEKVANVLGAASPEAAKAATAAERDIREAQKNPSRWERMTGWLKSKRAAFTKDIKTEGGIGAVVKKGKLGKLLKYVFLGLFFAISSVLYIGMESVDKKRH